MNIKDKMMENMMGKMSPEEVKEMMDKMMENFFSNMTKEEKQDMMNNMMPRMMEQMMGGSQGQGGGMMGMMGSMMGGKGSMMDMMRSMMGSKSGKESTSDGFNPMDMCKNMMATISQSSEIATFATPEVRQLFEEWVQQVDEEIFALVKEKSTISPDEIAEKLKISKSSAIYFLSRLAQKGKISINIAKAENQ
ncbi:MAG TPA: winged helix-turn-helix domain-containing protein [Clostridia bacterium]|nr:winged helix-turn-helix domain-containing protein [Clostridia bacterium]